MRNNKNVIIMPDRSGPVQTKTASDTVVQQGAVGKYATVGRRRKRGGKHVRDKQKRRMGRKMEVKVGTLNVGTMTGKGRELAEMMVKRKVDILCVQETKWKGSKARNIGDGCKIFYHGEDGRRNGVGFILSEEYIGRVLEVKRVSDRMMYMKLDIDGVMMTVISAYASQVGCLMEEKDTFWPDLDEVVESMPKEERVVAVRPAMLYWLETVALTKRQEAEMEVAQLKMLRFSLGVTRMYKMRNEYIRGTAQVGRFGEKTREARLRWYGHVLRKDDGYIGRRMLRMELPGMRKRGRPTRRFMDVVKEDMRMIQKIGATGDGKSAEATPDWKKAKEEEEEVALFCCLNPVCSAACSHCLLQLLVFRCYLQPLHN